MEISIVGVAWWNFSLSQAFHFCIKNLSIALPVTFGTFKTTVVTGVAAQVYICSFLPTKWLWYCGQH